MEFLQDQLSHQIRIHFPTPNKLEISFENDMTWNSQEDSYPFLTIYCPRNMSFTLCVYPQQIQFALLEEYESLQILSDLLIAK
jgi:hypothetical protein